MKNPFKFDLTGGVKFADLAPLADFGAELGDLSDPLCMKLVAPVTLEDGTVANAFDVFGRRLVSIPDDQIVAPTTIGIVLTLGKPE